MKQRNKNKRYTGNYDIKSSPFLGEKVVAIDFSEVEKNITESMRRRMWRMLPVIFPERKLKAEDIIQELELIDKIIKLQKENDKAKPYTKKEFMDILEVKNVPVSEYTDMELRLVATILAFMRDIQETTTPQLSSKFRVGDKVKFPLNGQVIKGSVVLMEGPDDNFPIVVREDSGMVRTFTKDGRYLLEGLPCLELDNDDGIPF